MALSLSTARDLSRANTERPGIVAGAHEFSLAGRWEFQTRSAAKAEDDDADDFEFEDDEEDDFDDEQFDDDEPGEEDDLDGFDDDDDDLEGDDEDDE